MLGQAIRVIYPHQKHKKKVHVNMCPEMSGFWVSLKDYIQQVP